MRRFLGVVTALTGVGLLAACGGGSGSAGDGSAEDGPWTVGLSNSFVGSEYRTQMVDALTEVFEEYEAEGVLDELVLENADTDTNGQIQQIRNLINRGVDVIIVNPSSETALNEVLKEATERGIAVYAVDQAVTEAAVTNVVIDQGEWARPSAEWLADEVGQGGKIVAVNGIAGHPANEVRWAVAQEVFDERGVEVLTVADGGWDQATAQQVMSSLLATYPDLDGVWTQDGMAQGVLRAVEAAGKVDDIKVTGEARGGFMRMWNDLVDSEFSSVGVVNPPGTAATALHVAVARLQGKEFAADTLSGNTLVLPEPLVVTNDNFTQEWEKVAERGDAYVVDTVLSRDEVSAYFE